MAQPAPFLPPEPEPERRAEEVEEAEEVQEVQAQSVGGVLLPRLSKGRNKQTTTSCRTERPAAGSETSDALRSDDRPEKRRKKVKMWILN